MRVFWSILTACPMAMMCMMNVRATIRGHTKFIAGAMTSLPKGPRIASESLDADTGSGSVETDPLPLPKIRARRDNICLISTYLVPLEPRTLLTNS